MEGELHATTSPSSLTGGSISTGVLEEQTSFALSLPAFEGPLDLLLHLIEREELDVTAVSLLAVTEQYLAHLRAADSIDLGQLADFIGIGARLLLLKSRALLPREPGEEVETSVDNDDTACPTRKSLNCNRPYDDITMMGDTGPTYKSLNCQLYAHVEVNETIQVWRNANEIICDD